MFGCNGANKQTDYDSNDVLLAIHRLDNDLYIFSDEGRLRFSSLEMIQRSKVKLLESRSRMSTTF